MKKRRILCLLLCLFLLLSGCTVPSLRDIAGRLFSPDKAETADSLSVWRIVSPADGELIRAETAAAGDIETLLTLFSSATRNDTLVCALPGGVQIEDWHFSNGVVTLSLSESFLSCTSMEQTLAAFCAALTLCQLDEVDAVNITVGEQTVFSGLIPEDAFLTAADTDPFVRQLRLYFPDQDGRYLISEYHSLTLDEDTSPERYVIEELLRGPNNGELQSVMPDGTTLLSCSTGEDGICTVDLSREFYDNRPDTALGERLVLYALVNSLAALSSVESVCILVEGQPVDTYVCLSLAEPLSRYDTAVGPVSQAKGETDLDLYLALPGLEEIAPLPFRVDTEGYTSLAEAALSALLDTEEPGYPTLFAGSLIVTDVTTQGTQCIVDLSESFFVSLPENARAAALRSITATLCALPEVSAVRFTVGGDPAAFDGTDWSGPWRSFNEIEVF